MVPSGKRTTTGGTVTVLYVQNRHHSFLKMPPPLGLGRC
jgi:hypothetical protein